MIADGKRADVFPAYQPFLRPRDCATLKGLKSVKEHEEISMVSALFMQREGCRRLRLSVLEAEGGRRSMRPARELGESGSSSWNNG